VKLNNCLSPRLYLKCPLSWFVTVQWISKLSATCVKVVEFTPRIGGFMGGYSTCCVLEGEGKNNFYSEHHNYIDLVNRLLFSFTKYLGYFSHHRIGIPAQRGAVP